MERPICKKVSIAGHRKSEGSETPVVRFEFGISSILIQRCWFNGAAVAKCGATK